MINELKIYQDAIRECVDAHEAEQAAYDRYLMAATARDGAAMRVKTAREMLLKSALPDGIEINAWGEMNRRIGERLPRAEQAAYG